MDVSVTAVSIGASIQSDSSCVGQAVCEVVVVENVPDSSTVARDIMVVLGEVPVLSQDVFEQVLVGASRYSEYGVVTAHDTAHFGFDHASLERCEVVVGEVLLRGIVVVAIAACLEVIDRVVLTCRDNLLVVEVISLHSWNKVADVVLNVVSILARSFLATSPARIAEVVHLQKLSAWLSSKRLYCIATYIRSPVVEPSVSIVAERPAFLSDNSTDSLNKLIIECGSIMNRSWEASSVAEVVGLRSELDSWCRAHTMGSLAPPFVSRQTDPTSAGRSIDEI
jgi:hypothetical protein